MLDQQLQRFCSQYLQLDNLTWPDADHLRQESFQEELYTRLFAENGGAKYKPPRRYQLRVLKQLTKKIEESIVNWDEEGISDNLMDQLSKLFFEPIPDEVSSAQQKSFVTYTISQLPPVSHPDPDPNSSPSPNPNTDSPTITLLESRNLLSAAGTTGLRTWEASFHLGNYLAANLSLIQGRSILELGSGTGYISILCAKYLGAREVLATDGSEDIVNSLPTNLYLNELEQSHSNSQSDSSESQSSFKNIRTKELRWGYPLLGTEEPTWNAGKQIDVILGADLTYNVTALVPLVATLNELFDLFPNVDVVLAATERNEKTVQVFFETCEKAGLLVEVVEFEVTKRELQMGPFYDDSVPIKVYVIKRRGASSGSAS